jgi:hypothetical protein
MPDHTFECGAADGPKALERWTERMPRQRPRPRPFAEIVGAVADRNAGALMARARLANRLAKTSSTGRARRVAYRAKVAALLALRDRFPARVAVEPDPMLPAFVLVRVTAARFTLHAPVERFAEGGARCAA